MDGCDRMTFQEAIRYIEAASWSQWKLGLDRTRQLLCALGDPQKELRFVHVAGTNGKGSTTAMIESILRRAGYRTGMYPSPFIEDFRERIQVCGEYITKEALCALTARVRAVADKMEDHPTQFELITAIGMLYFAQEGCDIVVLEVGMGGMYDSTNVIDAPELAVMTSIGLDHTEYLGDTVEKIAATKAGIIKPGASVVCYPNAPEVLAVIGEVCERQGCPFYPADMSRISEVAHSLDGLRFLWMREEEEEKGSEDTKAAQTGRSIGISLPLAGGYQLGNAAVALTSVEVLRRRGWTIPDEAVAEGMAQVRWPARFEVLRREPPFILDGGHNLPCAEAVAASLKALLPGQKMHLLIGMLADKAYEDVLDVLLPLAGDCLCVSPPSERALPAEELAACIRRRGCHAETFAGISDAVRAAWNSGYPVLAFGSLYMAGGIRGQVRKIKEETLS